MQLNYTKNEEAIAEQQNQQKSRKKRRTEGGLETYGDGVQRRKSPPGMLRMAQTHVSGK